MHPAGIEPASKAPQALILSIELRVLGGGGGIRTHVSLTAQKFSKLPEWTWLSDSSLPRILPASYLFFSFFALIASAHITTPTVNPIIAIVK